MAIVRFRVDDAPVLSERGFHCIEDDISETWLEDWAGAGLGELEAYLAKHADFLRFVEGLDAPQPTE
jgi:hypothetical protein